MSHQLLDGLSVRSVHRLFASSHHEHSRSANCRLRLSDNRNASAAQTVASKTTIQLIRHLSKTVSIKTGVYLLHGGWIYSRTAALDYLYPAVS